MGMMIKSLPALQAAGYEVAAWCFQADEDLPGLKVMKFPCPALMRRLDVLWFLVVANVYAVWWRVTKGGRPADLVHCTGANYISADIVSIHFVNAAWLKIQVGLGVDGLRSMVHIMMAAVASVFEYLQFRSPVRAFHAVAESIGGEIRRRCLPQSQIRVIPTPVNPANFSPSTRAATRESSRTGFGFADHEIVFSFVSQGAYRRKGLWLALEIIRELRRHDISARFLIIGGSRDVVAALKREIASRHPDASAWVLQAGFVPDLATALSAADAFLFPSYFEGFAAVEVQAAALGLPLLLTKHCGSEMILEEGVNGWNISFDPIEAAAKIRSLIPELKKDRPAFLKSSISEDEWIASMLALCQEVLTSKTPTERI